MRNIRKIYSANSQHWVGDGFLVQPLFSHMGADRGTDPFLMLDYAAPREFAPGNASHPRGVGQHPHKGFETVTIAYHGEVAHRDSTGGGGVIKEGDVQWMTAGAGIIHEEFHSEAFSQSGGMGKLAAEWMIDGEPTLDLFAWDIARFGDWTTKAFTRARVQDQYSHRFKIHFPDEERSAGRPMRQRPAYPMQQELGAVFGLNFGWEHPLWFAVSDEPREETAGFTRQNWWAPVGREVRMLREHLGVIDISNYAKYAVAGPGAEAWLNSVFANRMPTVVGKSCLTPLIGQRGGIAGDFTVAKLGEDDYRIFGSGMAEFYHKRLFDAVPLPAGTTFQTLTTAECGFNIAGPKSRQALQTLTQTPLANADFPFLQARQMTVAGIEVVALRVSFTGDLGWELYCDAADQPALYTALIAAADALQGGPVGSRALGSLRVEKGYGSWGREYSPEYWPQESGLARLIKGDKEFLNKAAWLAIKDNPPRDLMVCLAIEAQEADATGGEPIFLPDGTPIGQVSTGAYGYSVGASLALGYVKAAHAIGGTEVTVSVLGRPHRARILNEPAFDPAGERLRY